LQRSGLDTAGRHSRPVVQLRLVESGSAQLVDEVVQSLPPMNLPMSTGESSSRRPKRRFPQTELDGGDIDSLDVEKTVKRIHYSLNNSIFNNIEGPQFNINVYRDSSMSFGRSIHLGLDVTSAHSVRS
jgi:hypothetical protein